MYVPPWLNVSPSDFTAAVQGGAKAGTALAEMGTQANMNMARIASSDKQNAMRVAADNAQANARLAAAAQQAQEERALKQWEEAQRYELGTKKLSADEAQLAQQIAQQNATFDISRQRQALLERQQTGREKTAEERKLAPVFRTVENQVVQIDPTTGTAKSLFTAPFRPTAMSAVDRLIAEGGGKGTTTGTNATALLTPDAAKKFLEDAGGDRKKAEDAAKKAGFTW
jgi:hypothetical protein